MTHLGFVATAYALGVAIPLLFSITAMTRLRSAQRRLAAVDPRRIRGSGHDRGF